MSNVTLSIGGREYTVACDPGEEPHIQALGRSIDGKVAALNLSGQGETRTLLFAALLLADELAEKGGATAAAQSPTSGAQDDTAAAEALESLAGRLEQLATRLEG